ncbi:hypothetical protein [Paramagnetospirillum kuznetsovii]|uniref:hypothetical protein n=1 Tax=Paramagnetospirillum kuznetsovii TaxID=2053833 RepID=UPI0011BF6AD3|nr:hypothetical protein [Paramagnetospirillum kuznetsovii]
MELESKIVVRLTGQSREMVEHYIQSLKSASLTIGYDLSVEWGPSAHRDTDVCDAIVMATRRDRSGERSEFVDFPILVHDRHARGFAGLQIKQNRRQAGV